MIDQTPYRRDDKTPAVRTFSIVSKSGTTIQISGGGTSLESLSSGTILDLYDFSNSLSGKAVVSSVTPSNASARIVAEDDNQQYRFALISNWWNAEQPHEEVLSEDVFTDSQEYCTLEVNCVVSSNHVAGFIGWTLFAQLIDDEELGTYQQSLIPVAVGNDLNNRGRVYFRHLGAWKPGVYLIRIKRYSPRQLITLQDADFRWSLTESSFKLSAGSLSDVSPPINFK
jgi:hypothetical protein